jgi:hypothetical protein
MSTEMAAQHSKHWDKYGVRTSLDAGDELAGDPPIRFFIRVLYRCGSFWMTQRSYERKITMSVRSTPQGNPHY